MLSGIKIFIFFLFLTTLNKGLLFTIYYYESFCFKREISALKRLIDSKAWCQLSFLLELLSPQDKTRRIA